MTWLCALSAIAVALVAGGVWLATSRGKVRKRKADFSWPGKPMRVIDHGPADLPYWAGDRKP
jgi:hypothetical protein